MTGYSRIVITGNMLRQGKPLVRAMHRRLVEVFQDAGVVDLGTIQLAECSRNSMNLSWELLYTAETPD